MLSSYPLVLKHPDDKKVIMIPVRDSIRSRSFPVVTILFILINTLVFIYQIIAHGSLELLVLQYAAVPADITEALRNPAGSIRIFITPVTSMFLHGGIFHILGNMLYLWIFGDNVEDRLGHVWFLIFYLVCGLVAVSVHIFLHSGSDVPLVGASGAIAGVLGAYLIMYPFARVQAVIPLIIFFPVVRLPALVFLGGWFIIQLISGYTSYSQDVTGGVAWSAHAGGFVAGVLWVLIFGYSRK
jgi:membrane associated rhomboid family serine protease